MEAWIWIRHRHCEPDKACCLLTSTDGSVIISQAQVVLERQTRTRRVAPKIIETPLRKRMHPEAANSTHVIALLPHMENLDHDGSLAEALSEKRSSQPTLPLLPVLMPRIGVTRRDTLKLLHFPPPPFSPASNPVVVPQVTSLFPTSATHAPMDQKTALWPIATSIITDKRASTLTEAPLTPINLFSSSTQTHGKLGSSMCEKAPRQCHPSESRRQNSEHELVALCQNPRTPTSSTF